MPAVDSKVLRAAVRDGTYAPAYYFYGDDDYLKDEELKRTLAAAVDPATRDFNFEQLRGADLDAETLGSILSTPPMMADRRVVVVRDTAALKKDARAMLDKYLKSPASDLLLMLVAPAGAKADKGLDVGDDRDRVQAAQRCARSEVDRVLRRTRSEDDDH